MINRIPLPDRTRELMHTIAMASAFITFDQMAEARRQLRMATHQLKALRIAAGDKPLARRQRSKRK